MDGPHSAIGAITLATVQRDGFSVGERCSRVSVPTTCSPSEASGEGNQGVVLRVREGLGADLDLLTGLAESSRGRPLTWTERAL